MPRILPASSARGGTAAISTSMTREDFSSTTPDGDGQAEDDELHVEQQRGDERHALALLVVAVAERAGLQRAAARARAARRLRRQALAPQDLGGAHVARGRLQHLLELARPGCPC